jgi:uncharacterized alkaline shock family protein YloU
MSAEDRLILSILKKLPNEMNGGIIVMLLVNILYRYDMAEEWDKIVEAVDSSVEAMTGTEVNVIKVLLN